MSTLQKLLYFVIYTLQNTNHNLLHSSEFYNKLLKYYNIYLVKTLHFCDVIKPQTHDYSKQFYRTRIQ